MAWKAGRENIYIMSVLHTIQLAVIRTLQNEDRNEKWSREMAMIKKVLSRSSSRYGEVRSNELRDGEAETGFSGPAAHRDFSEEQLNSPL
jgi:hypothetical protein